MRCFRAVSKVVFTASILCLSEVSLSHAEEDIERGLPLVETPSVPALFYSSSRAASIQSQANFDIFAPKQQTLNTRFDYSVWDAALEDGVIQMGPSLRVFAKRTEPRLGTLIKSRAHDSPYRLEGSRVTFHYFTDKYKTSLTQYKDDLVRLAHEHDIQSFDRNEQLAFWINLHNVVLIDTISQRHPTRSPSALVFGEDETPLHEAKLISIKNIPLSLKDIREQIVYKNWKDPNVIYGFFRGDIGGPGIMPFAVTGDNVKYVLSANGAEYATSLRGFQTSRTERKVSSLYHEARPYYFSNWPRDLETHLKDYLKEPDYLLAQLEQEKPIGLIEYDTITADLWGGHQFFNAATVSRQTGFSDTPPILFERRKKIDELKGKGLLKRKGSTRIIDEETEDKAVVE